MRVQYKQFDSKFVSRDRILRSAAEFASQVGPERLINITHTEDRQDTVILVWYWEGARANVDASHYADRSSQSQPVANPAADTRAESVDADTMTDRPDQALPREVPAVAGAFFG
jgi:hypothetical protein